MLPTISSPALQDQSACEPPPRPQSFPKSPPRHLIYIKISWLYFFDGKIGGKNRKRKSFFFLFSAPFVKQKKHFLLRGNKYLLHPPVTGKLVKPCE
jgi:hypothetical protein